MIGVRVHRRLTSLGLAGLALVLLTSLAPVRAQAPVAAAQEMIQALGDTAIRVLGDASLNKAGKRAELESLIGASFSIPTIARFAIGRTWAQMSDPQKDEYQDLFRQSLIQSYEGRLERFDGQTMEVTGATPTADGRDALVDSVIRNPEGGEPVLVTWRVRDISGTPKVIDVIIEDVSLLITQRDEFSALVARAGNDPEALLASLRAKLSAN